MTVPRVLTETRLSLNQAAKHAGAPYSTVHRWAKRGVGGVRLETAKLGGRLFTSVEAVERLIAAMNPDQPPAPRERTLAERTRACKAATAELIAAGW